MPLKQEGNSGRSKQKRKKKKEAEKLSKAGQVGICNRCCHSGASVFSQPSPEMACPRRGAGRRIVTLWKGDAKKIYRKIYLVDALCSVLKCVVTVG
jgi:hypothetical protein